MSHRTIPEQRSLLRRNESVGRDTTRIGAMNNFIILSVAFGFAQGSISVGIAYATSVFSPRLWNYSVGTAYLSYTVGSLLFAAPLVDVMGSQRALSLALLCYLIYLCTLTLGTNHAIEENVDLIWTIMITGSHIGGFGAAVGWVAQGVYFASAAALHPADTGAKDATDVFAALFAAIYVAVQCFLYGFSTLLLQETLLSTKGLFALLLVLTSCSWVAATCFLEPLRLPADRGGGSPPREAAAVASSAGGRRESLETLVLRAKKSGWRRLTTVLELTVCDARALGLAPLNISFGFIIVFFDTFVDLETVRDHIGKYAVGYCGSIQTGTIALLALPMSTLALTHGKTTVLALGAICYILIAAAFISFSNAQIGEWNYLAPMFCLFGGARLIWESTLKAIVADFYPEKEELSTAFANLSFVSGLSATIFGFAVVYLDRQGLAIMVLVPAVLIVPGFRAALAILPTHKRRRMMGDEEEEATF